MSEMDEADEVDEESLDVPELVVFVLSVAVAIFSCIDCDDSFSNCVRIDSLPRLVVVDFCCRLLSICVCIRLEVGADMNVSTYELFSSSRFNAIADFGGAGRGVVSLSVISIGFLGFDVAAFELVVASTVVVCLLANSAFACFSISRTRSSSSSSFFFHAINSSACLRRIRSFFSRSVKNLYFIFF